MPNPIQLLKKIPGVLPLSRLLKSPSKEMEMRRKFALFRQTYGELGKEAWGAGKHVLIASLAGHWVNIALIEGVFARALACDGLEPVVLTIRNAWVNSYFQSMGVRKFVYLDDVIGELSSIPAPESVYRGISDQQALMDFSFHGISVGKYVCSTLLRESLAGHLDLKHPQVHARMCSKIQTSMQYALAAEQILDSIQPQKVVFLERGYTPYGEFFDAALNRRMDVVQWCGSHREDAFMLKRYSLENSDKHPASLSNETWKLLSTVQWSDCLGDAVRKELFDQYSSGKWYAEVGTQFNTQLLDRESILKKLKVAPGRRVGAVFAHMFWDATFFWGVDRFNDYQDWFVETVKEACRNTAIDWIIKVHPANAVKLKREGYKGELAEIRALKAAVGALPPHVHLLMPDSDISTYSLYAAIDYCLTVRGTVGIEAALTGARVLTAGTGRYDGHGFTVDSASREEFLERVRTIHTTERLSKDEIETAERFAYGTFLLRPFALRSLSIAYKQDAVATQNLVLNIRSDAELKNAPDLKEFRTWNASLAEDFLDPAALTALNGAR
jgi:hypothetical protein